MSYVKSETHEMQEILVKERENYNLVKIMESETETTNGSQKIFEPHLHLSKFDENKQHISDLDNQFVIPSDLDNQPVTPPDVNNPTLNKPIFDQTQQTHQEYFKNTKYLRENLVKSELEINNDEKNHGYHAELDLNTIEKNKEQLLKDFFNTFHLVKRDEDEKIKKYKKALWWISKKSVLLAMLRTSFFGTTMMITGLIFPHLALLTFFGTLTIVNMLANTNSPKHQRFIENMQLINRESIANLPEPHLLSKWLEEFTSYPLNAEQMRIIIELANEVPDHPLFTGFAKAYKASQHGINLRATYHEMNSYLADGAKTLNNLKYIYEMKGVINNIKSKNPNINFHEINNEKIAIFLNDARKDAIIDLKYEEIASTTDIIYNYLYKIQEEGVKALNLV